MKKILLIQINGKNLKKKKFMQKFVIQFLIIGLILLAVLIGIIYLTNFVFVKIIVNSKSDFRKPML